MACIVARPAHGHKSARRGRPPKSYAVTEKVTALWRYRPDQFYQYLTQDWCRDDRDELTADILCWLHDRARLRKRVGLLRDRLRFKWGPDPGHVAEFIRCALRLGLVRAEALDPQELPGELPVVLVDNEVARVELVGPVGSCVNGRGLPWPVVADVTVMITSKVDGGTALALPASVTGKKLPYFQIYKKPIERLMPALWTWLKTKGAFTSYRSRMILLSRLVLAVGGSHMEALHAHHLDAADGTLYAGFSTLDCRIEVLEPMGPKEHRNLHAAGSGEHYLAPLENTASV